MPHQITNLALAGDIPIITGTAAMLSFKNRSVHVLLIPGGFWVPELCPVIKTGESPTPLTITDICGAAKYEFTPIPDIEGFISNVPVPIRRLIGHIKKRDSSKRAAKSDDVVVTKKVKKSQSVTPSQLLEDTIDFDDGIPTPKSPLQTINPSTSDVNVPPVIPVQCFLCPTTTTHLGQCENPACTMHTVSLCQPCLAHSCTFGHVPQRTSSGVPRPTWQPDTCSTSVMVPRIPDVTPGKCVMCHKVEMNVTICTNRQCEIFGYGAMCRQCFSAGCQQSHMPKRAELPPPVPSPVSSAPSHSPSVVRQSPSQTHTPTFVAANFPPFVAPVPKPVMPRVVQQPMKSTSPSDHSDTPRGHQVDSKVTQGNLAHSSELQPFGPILELLSTILKSVESLATSVRQSSSSPASVSQVRQTSVSAARFEERVVQNRCFVCGSLGHWVKDCPKSKK